MEVIHSKLTGRLYVCKAKKVSKRERNHKRHKENDGAYK